MPEFNSYEQTEKLHFAASKPDPDKPVGYDGELTAAQQKALEEACLRWRPRKVGDPEEIYRLVDRMEHSPINELILEAHTAFFFARLKE